jgi:hypothetical protein
MELFGEIERLTSMEATIATNLRNIFADATPSEYTIGKSWYSDARAAIRALASETCRSVEVFAAITAALSPRILWGVNLDAATAFARCAQLGLEMPTVAGFKANRNRAWIIANSFGQWPGSLLSGPKVSAFYANLTGDESAVTIDVWILRAADVRYANIGNCEQITNAITDIAREYKLSPAKVQAVIWTVMRSRWND